MKHFFLQINLTIFDRSLPDSPFDMSNVQRILHISLKQSLKHDFLTYKFKKRFILSQNLVRLLVTSIISETVRVRQVFRKGNLQRFVRAKWGVQWCVNTYRFDILNFLFSFYFFYQWNINIVERMFGTFDMFLKTYYELSLMSSHNTHVHKVHIWSYKCLISLSLVFCLYKNREFVLTNYCFCELIYRCFGICISKRWLPLDNILFLRDSSSFSVHVYTSWFSIAIDFIYSGNFLNLLPYHTINHRIICSILCLWSLHGMRLVVALVGFLCTSNSNFSLHFLLPHIRTNFC